MRLSIVISLLLYIAYIANSAFAQSDVFSEGEELNYVVSYGFVDLGEVKMKVEKIRKEKDFQVINAKCTMKSYDGIPFVSLNSIFESEIIFNGAESYSSKFKAIDHQKDAVINIEYTFRYDSQFVHVKKTNNGKVERDENIAFNKDVKFQDGLSLFYAARINSFKSENFLIPVFMNEAETSVNYFFASKPEEISIAIADDDLNAVRCTGTANFTGVFGLTGEFAGWFSDDRARVPLLSQLNVYIGNVTLELKSYKRNGWKYF